MSKAYKHPKESESQITELMTPEKANFSGKIHGGHILSLLDKIAYVCASKHAENYCVTASVDTVDFLNSVEVGDLVHFYATVNYTGKTSMVVGVKVVAENIKRKTVRHTNTSYFTMVAIGEDGKPAFVPGLLLDNDTSKRRFIEALKRKELKQEYKSRFEQDQQTQKSFQFSETHNCQAT